jgi:hypothetical protein
VASESDLQYGDTIVTPVRQDNTLLCDCSGDIPGSDCNIWCLVLVCVAAVGDRRGSGAIASTTAGCPGHGKGDWQASLNLLDRALMFCAMLSGT